jgi:FAD/FMN-containing dehydrogenase
LAHNEAQRDALWAGRRSISETVRANFGAKSSQDLGVQRSRLPELVREIKQIGRKHGIQVLAYGHAGDANLHFNFVYDPSDSVQVRAHTDTVDAAIQAVLLAEGTITGEHGIGSKKRDVFTASLNPVNLELMIGLKQLFDPQNLLNPRKVLAQSVESGGGSQ